MPQQLDDTRRQKLDTIVAQMEANGEPEDAIRAVVQDFKVKYAAAEPSTPKNGGGLVDALPSALGTAFSFAGGSKALPTGLALSALGGAAGEGARQVIRSVQGQWDQVPETMGGRIKAMGREAVGQGAMEGVGRGLAGVVTPIAKAAYGLAVRPAKALRKTYGTLNLVNQGFTDKILPNSFGQSRAVKLLGQSKNEASQIAADSPQTFELKRVLQKATDDQGQRMGDQMKSAGIAPKIDQASEQIGRVLDSNPDRVTAAELLALRRGADKTADPAFKAARLPGGAGAVPPGSESSVARSMADAERQTLNDALGSQWKATNTKTRARSGVFQATQDAAMRPNMLTNLIAGGAGASALTNGDLGDAAERALLFRTLFSPTAQAGAAFAAPAVAKYGPRVADIATGGDFKNALLRFMSGQQETKK